MKRIYLTTFCATALGVLSLAASTQAAVEPAKAAQPAAPSAAASPGTEGKLDRHDHSFLKRAAEINMKEIEVGKLAEQRSTDPNVKKVAEHLVKDHEEANKNLARLAASKGVALPKEMGVWDRRAIEKLEKEQGDNFNKEFLSMSSKGHEKALSLFEKEAARTQDPDIKAWAEKMVPALRGHLAMSLNTKPETVGEKPKQAESQKQQESQKQPQKQHKKGQQQQSQPQ